MDQEGPLERLFESMNEYSERLALEAFHRTATRVPAYRVLLQEAGITPERITSFADFAQVPVLGKGNTFQRFGVAELCLDGELGHLGTVLTSSGHSGIFAFGLTEAAATLRTSAWIDDALDALFAVRTHPTLLINCLPMGVKVPTQVCTLAETSVRPDMVNGLVRAFGSHYHQLVLIGETAFIKHTLELGRRSGIDWPSLRVHVIVGEEPLAENARKYLEKILGIDPLDPRDGVVFSSMGVAEVGLNLFAEVPPLAPLITLRRALHEDAELREQVIGRTNLVPSIFTYDPTRILVEFDANERLILTTLDLTLRLPLIRYATGDRGALLRLRPALRTRLEAAGVPWQALESLPMVMIQGRGEHAVSGEAPVYPEAVKEGIYHDPELAEMITANFRLVSGPDHVLIRLQLSPGIRPDKGISHRFEAAIARYVPHPLEVSCEAYEDFRSGMTLDYERKFQYLGHD